MQSNLLSTVILFIILGIIQMNSQSFYFCSFLTLFFSLILIHVPQGSTNPEFYQTCGNTYSCGDIAGLSYPFRSVNDPPFCGYPGFELNCNQDSSTTMVIKNMKYRIVDVFPTTQTIRIVREDIMESTCPVDLVNTTLDYSLFDYAAGYTNLTFLYNCPVSSYSAETDVIACRNSKYHNVFVLPGAVGPGKCNASVTVPVLQVSAATVGSLNSSGLGQLIREGFDIRWKIDSKACSKCTEKKGRCVYDDYMKQTTCFCPPGSPYESACSVDAFGFSPPLPISMPSPSPDSGKRFSISKKVAIGGSVGIAGLVLISVSMIYCLRSRGSCCEPLISWKIESEDHKIEEFMRNYGSHAPKLYIYSDLKKITSSFSQKIGQGGFGQVYKGKLPDGRAVAIKVLTETNGDGEEYINEVASISRTSHVNIVELLGFCYQRNKRALIYEYVPNSSLDKFLNNGPSGITCPLGWTTLYRIAIGIARGLEYLHRGCNTRIVHFDIKPHNILLDQDFCPKISDFGLSKLCERKESILSMLGARGTAGYIAPEVFSRAFGHVSHKSDVYSYGMLVLEMVGVRNNVEVSTSEVYFPQWIYEHLELGKDLSLQGIMNEEDEEIARKMILVGLWCIQTKPSDRPAIGKAVEMLEGSLHSLQVPPKPVLFSPPKSILESFTSTSTTT